MTRVDFYVLAGTDPDERLTLVCRLAEKAMGRSQTVFIHSRDTVELHKLDAALWSFRALSFVPHQVLLDGATTGSTDNDPVHLSNGEPDNDRQLLINLDYDVPAFFSRFERTLEIVNEQPEIQKSGRERYRFYKQRGYPLQHHEM